MTDDGIGVARGDVCDVGLDADGLSDDTVQRMCPPPHCGSSSSALWATASGAAAFPPPVRPPQPERSGAESEHVGARVDDVLEYRAKLVRRALHGIIDGSGSAGRGDSGEDARATTFEALAALPPALQDEFWAWTEATFSRGMVDVLRAPCLSAAAGAGAGAAPRRALYCSRMIGDCCRLLEKRMESAAKGSQFYSFMEAFGRIAMDLMLHIKDSQLKLPSSALKWVAEYVLKPKKGAAGGAADDNFKIDLDYETQFRLYERGDFAALAEIGVYCARDTVLPLRIARTLKVLEGLICISRVSSTQPHTCQNGGQQIKVFTAMSRFVHRKYGFFKGDCDWMRTDPEDTTAAAATAAAAELLDPRGSAVTAASKSPAGAVRRAAASAQPQPSALFSMLRARAPTAPQPPRASSHSLGAAAFASTAPRLPPLHRAPAQGSSTATATGAAASCSEAERGEPQQGRCATKRKAPEYEGATVLPPIPGFYEDPVSTLDFASLYPSIMMAHNLCPSTLASPATAARIRAHPRGMVAAYPIVHFRPDGRKYTTHYHIVQGLQAVTAQLLEHLVNERKKVKNLMKAAEGTPLEDVYDELQKALKVLCNSTYGFYGCNAKTGMMSCMVLAALTTSIGRNMIAATKTYAERRVVGSRVIYGDTDSIMLLHPPGTTLEAANKTAEGLAADITETMRRGEEEFATLGGAPHWRNVVNTLCAEEGERACTAATADALARELAAGSDADAALATAHAEGVRAGAAAESALRALLRDFASACKALEIAPEKEYW